MQPDGSKRLLGPYLEAAWSPHGLFVAVTKPDELAAVEPSGSVHWTLARPDVLRPRWVGTRTDTRIAYFTAGRLHLVAGGRYVSTSLAEKLATYLSSDSHKPPQELLSDREFQVLRLIASGRIVSEIARELSLSVKTISTYRTRILEKMGLRNNAELMHYAMQHQLVE